MGYNPWFQIVRSNNGLVVIGNLIYRTRLGGRVAPLDLVLRLYTNRITKDVVIVQFFQLQLCLERLIFSFFQHVAQKSFYPVYRQVKLAIRMLRHL